MFRHQPGLGKVSRIFSTNTVNEQNFSGLLDQFVKFKSSAEKIKEEELSSRIKLSKKIYLYTKEFLDNNNDNLSPTEKVVILKKYIELWAMAKCILHIQDTAYSEQYKKSKFSKYSDSYNQYSPMLAGFNLQGALLGNLHSSALIFLSVNFEKADFSNVEFPYSHFENCNLSEIKVTNNTNFNQCRFTKCNLEKAGLQSENFCEVVFNRCNFRKADFKKANLYKVHFDECHLQEADLREVELDRTYFKKCNLFQAQFDSNRNLRLYDCVNFSPVDASPEGNPLTELQDSLLRGFVNINPQTFFAQNVSKFGIFSPVDASPDGNPLTELQDSISRGFVGFK